MSADTPSELLAAYDAFMSGRTLTAEEKATADMVARAAAFGAAAYEAAQDADQGAHCIARAFLMALIDPMQADLDYLRRDPEAVAKLRATT